MYAIRSYYDRQLAAAERPVQRAGLHPFHQHRAADDEAGLRATEQLVAAEGHDVRARRDAFVV